MLTMVSLQHLYLYMNFLKLIDTIGVAQQKARSDDFRQSYYRSWQCSAFTIEFEWILLACDKNRACFFFISY